MCDIDRVVLSFIPILYGLQTYYLQIRHAVSTPLRQNSRGLAVDSFPDKQRKWTREMDCRTNSEDH